MSDIMNINFNDITGEMLKVISDYDSKTGFKGAYNIRENSQCAGRKSSENITINPKTDKPGIDIIVKPGTKGETVFIPACVTHTAVDDLVYNDFYIGEGADVVIVAGCGVHNEGEEDARHNGNHRFFLEPNSSVLYKEKHIGTGSGADLVSRSVARGNSHQAFYSVVEGNNRCTGHSACDAIIAENGRVDAQPALNAKNVDAELIHEAAIGKIAGEQITKLCSLGLTKEQAEEKIIQGFLK